MGTSSGRTCSWPTCTRQRLNVIDGQPWCSLHGHPGFANFRQDPGPTASEASSAPPLDEGVKSSDPLESPTSLERELFANSAYSNPYWSDSVDEEDQELIRGEITRRQQVLDEASNQMSRTPLWRRGRLKRIIREGVVYPSEELNSRSVARFQLWLAELRSEDPKQHAFLKWFLENELKAERERRDQEAIRKLEAEKKAQTWARWERRLDKYFEWDAANMERGPQRTRHLHAADRRRAEANDQHGQEKARQAVYQASGSARRSEPTCVFCDRPGMHDTASGWMCGIHLHHLM